MVDFLFGAVFTAIVVLAWRGAKKNLSFFK